MYTSPIEVKLSEHFSVLKTVEFDREQYEQGWHDRDSEIVKCKDCYYCVTEKSFDKEYLYCDAFYEHAEGDLIGVSLMVEPNHFCSWGERREDETD